MRLDFTLPGFGNKISYRDGIIRIQQKQQPTTIKDGNNSNNNNNNDDANADELKCFVIPNDAWKSTLRSSFEEENSSSSSSSSSPSPSSSSSSSFESKFNIEIKMTETKGYGVFFVPSLSSLLSEQQQLPSPQSIETMIIPKYTFLGFYKGVLIKSREELDRLHQKRRRTIIDAAAEAATVRGEESKNGTSSSAGTTRCTTTINISNVADYVMSLDGGMHFLDGYEYRATSTTTTTNTPASASASLGTKVYGFTPAQLNHATRDTKECNIVRKLVYVPDDYNTIIDATGIDINMNTMDDTIADDYPRTLPRIAFFASRDIQWNEELCFDYGTNFWKTKEKKRQQKKQD